MEVKIVYFIKNALRPAVFVLFSVMPILAQAVDTAPKQVVDNFKAASTICAVCGAKIDITAKTPYSDYMGTRYYFASPSYKSQFDANSFKYASDILTCAVCGAQENRKARTFLEQKENKKSYYFCCPPHQKEFSSSPLKYTAGKNAISSTTQFRKPFNNEYDDSEILSRASDVSIVLQVVTYDFKMSVTVKEKGKEKIKKPAAGSIFVELQAKITNATNRELRMIPGKWEMIDTDGNFHSIISNPIANGLPFILQPKGKVDLVFVFEGSFGVVPKMLVLKNSSVSGGSCNIEPRKKE